MTDLRELNQPAAREVQHAKATAAVLEQEFAAPFVIYDRATSRQLWPQVGTDSRGGLAADELPTFETSERAVLNVLPNGNYRLRLLLGLPGRGALVAETALVALVAGPHAAEEQFFRNVEHPDLKKPAPLIATPLRFH